MNLEKVVFGFFILLAATLNFGFVYGDIGNPDQHNGWELFAAIIASLIAVILKFGDRTHIGAVHLASSLVALLQLFAAAIVWFLMRAPDSHRLLSWLTSTPGSYLPPSLPPRIPAAPGHWIVCGYGRFGNEVVAAVQRGGFRPPSSILPGYGRMGFDQSKGSARARLFFAKLA